MNTKRKAKKDIKLGYYYFWKGESDVGFYYLEKGLGNISTHMQINEGHYYFLAEKYLDCGDKDKAIKFSKLGGLIFNTKNRLGIQKEKLKKHKK